MDVSISFEGVDFDFNFIGNGWHFGNPFLHEKVLIPSVTFSK